MVRKSILTLLFTVFLLLGLSFGQETLSQVQREMARVEKETEREKKLHQTEKQKSTEFETRKKQKVAALEKQLHDLDGKTTEIRGRVADLKAQKNNLAQQIKNFEIKQKSVSDHILHKITELITFFEKDFPHQREHKIQQLKNLQGEIQDGSVIPEMAIGRLFTFLQAAVASGYEAEVYAGSYTGNDSKTYEGNYLRLGMALSAFVSLDGNKIGYLILQDGFQEGKYTWIDENLSAEIKQNIKAAIQISEGKAPPALVLLPFRVNTRSSEQGGNP